MQNPASVTCNRMPTSNQHFDHKDVRRRSLVSWLINQMVTRKCTSHRSPDCRDVYIGYTPRECHWTDTSCLSARYDVRVAITLACRFHANKCRKCGHRGPKPRADTKRYNENTQFTRTFRVSCVNKIWRRQFVDRAEFFSIRSRTATIKHFRQLK